MRDKQQKAWQRQEKRTTSHESYQPNLEMRSMASSTCMNYEINGVDLLSTGFNRINLYHIIAAQSVYY